MNNLKLQKSNFISTKTTPISKDYTLGKKCGEGAFGCVRLAVHKATKQVRAVKVLKKSGQDMNLLFQEVEILSKLSHPNIMQIYEVYNDKTNFYIVSEYCQGGELFDILSENGSLTEKDASVIMKQILSAVCYSHQNHIVHRDLKPENILLDSKKQGDLMIKIIDWGCAMSFSKNKKMTEADGTAYYVAPEVLMENYDEKCDIWSCGVIMYIMLCGYPPFNGETDEDIYEKVKIGKFEFPSEDWSNVSEQAIDLVKKMLTYEPKQRYNAQQCLDHEWFKMFKNKEKINKEVGKTVLKNMKNFKQNKKFEQATIGYIVNQLISKEESKELLKQFQDWDKNGDGVLNREEIIEGYKKTFGAVDENEIDNMIQSVDLDGNGVIDYNEFLHCAISKDKILSNEKLEIAFKSFDADGSGKISADEIMAIFTKGGKAANAVDKEVFEKMIKDADCNGDGEISFNEFKTIMKNFFN